MNAALKPDPTLEVKPGSGSRLRGWIDVCAIRNARLPALDRSRPGVARLASDWISTELDTRAGDCYVSTRSIVLALGHPTLDGASTSAAALGACADAQALHSSAIGGRFATVVIGLETQTVALSTDRFNVWPLCWAWDGSRLSFSDRADCVPTSGSLELDPQALFNYVYFHVIPAPRTVFRGVSRLEPASELVVQSGTLRLGQRWIPRFSLERRESLPELATRFRDTVRQSVVAEASSASVGCFLSGGTDSSTVAGVLKRESGRAATFSMGFDQQGYDEMEYARIAARHFGTEHHEHYVTPGELVDAIPLVAAHYDQPFGNSSAVPAFICARLARDTGVKKLLAGDGGDELFGGNTRYAKQKIFEAWWSIPMPLRKLARPMLANGVTRNLPLARKAASYVDQASVPMPGRLETYNLLHRFGPDNVFERCFLEGVAQSEPVELQESVYHRNDDAHLVDRMLAYDWRFTLADNDLPKVAGTTSLAGLDVGFPLLTDSLVDLSTALAPQDKVRGLRLRHFFKEALTGFLPDEIIAKKKHGFGLPVGAWLVRDAAFRALAQDSVAALAGRGFVRTELVDDLFSRRLAEHAGFYGEMVWILMMLEQWLSARAPAWKA